MTDAKPSITSGLTIKPMFSGIISKFKPLRCPLCRQILTRSDVGIKSHLRKHVRGGEITSDRALALSKELWAPTADVK